MTDGLEEASHALYEKLGGSDTSRRPPWFTGVGMKTDSLVVYCDKLPSKKIRFETFQGFDVEWKAIGKIVIQ